MRFPTWLSLVAATALAAVLAPLLLRGVNAYWVITGLSVGGVGALAYIAGLLTASPTRSAILSWAGATAASQELLLNLLRSYLLTVQMGQQHQTQALERIERVVRGETAPSRVSDDQLKTYLRRLKAQGAIPQEDLQELLLLCCQALLDGEDALVQDGRCIVCGSENHTLLEHPIDVPQAHAPGCPVPARVRLANEILANMAGSSQNAKNTL